MGHEVEDDTAGWIILLIFVVAALSLGWLLDGVSFDLDYAVPTECNYVWTQGEDGVWMRMRPCAPVGG